ncbi:MAG: CDP-alcohol phosphatidyltransferase family protein [Devosia sp.]
MGTVASSRLGHVLAVLPHVLTATRVASAPLIVWLIFDGEIMAATVLCIAGMITDYIDGPLIRRFGTPSKAGAYFDVWADFLIVLAVFGGLGLAGLLPLWPLVPICASFALFIATFERKPTIYDPVGRYIGGMLMTAAVVLLVAQDFLVQEVVSWTVAVACSIAMVGRLAYLAPWGASARPVEGGALGD